MEKLNLTWAQFDRAVDLMADHYRDKGIKKIIGISRGGLPLAVALSHRLQIPMSSITWQTRDGRRKDEHLLRGETKIFEKGEVLCIDDIRDTGNTILQINQRFKNLIWATWIYRGTKMVNGDVDFSVSVLPTDFDKWITFPWEKTI